MDKKTKQRRKDVRKRLHQLLHPYSQKSKEAKRKAQLKERRSAGSAAASSSAAAGSSAAGGVGSAGNAAASSSTADGQNPPSPSHTPLTSYLRPCNIIGGGFVCTKAGYVPRFVVAYWERHRGAVP